MTVHALINQIKKDTNIWRSPIHGLRHWKNVEENGLFLAHGKNINLKIISYFSYLHDCCRENENSDPLHGPRAARYAKRNRELFDLNDVDFKKLIRACSGHTFAEPSNTINLDHEVLICWDADRLDLTRVGIRPDPERLFTKEAKMIFS
tara:strand:- start:137 stop:583 length:447 start_codon:yes stop_codon:yes gene_type:complete